MPIRNNVWRDFEPAVLAFAMVARKRFKGKFTANNDFPIGYFRLPLLTLTVTDADIGSLKTLHTLFDKYLDHMLVNFERNRMIQNVQHFKLFPKQNKKKKNG